jgi:hypothetical protein
MDEKPKDVERDFYECPKGHEVATPPNLIDAAVRQSRDQGFEASYFCEMCEAPYEFEMLKLSSPQEASVR